MLSYGHLSARVLLDSPDIDGLVAPFIYVVKTRAQTSPLFPQIPYSSLAIKGELMIVEDDLRTMFAGSREHPTGYQWCFDLDCTQNVMWRNILGQAILQVGSYRFDLMGSGWFGKDDTAVHRAWTAALWKTSARRKRPSRTSTRCMAHSRSRRSLFSSTSGPHSPSRLTGTAGAPGLSTGS